MSLIVSSAPYMNTQRSMPNMMLLVMLCMLPALVVQTYFFGWGVVIQIAFASIIALIFESLILILRKKKLCLALSDGSALVTAWLLAAAIPPDSPWWIMVIGLFFAIVIAKHLYGGLGQNIFNPAMVAYVVLLISFPVPMTSWNLPENFMFGYDLVIKEKLTLLDHLSLIFTNFTTEGLSLEQTRLTVDGVTMATPLDAMKHSLQTVMVKNNWFGINLSSMHVAWYIINGMYLLGGLWLMVLKVIRWHISVSLLVSFTICNIIFYAPLPIEEMIASVFMQLFSGSVMIGAFFIATDPVSAATSVKGRLIFGALIGMLLFVIRAFGSYPDGIAFAVLLANLTTPLLDNYTKPRVYGN